MILLILQSITERVWVCRGSSSRTEDGQLMLVVRVAPDAAQILMRGTMNTEQKWLLIS